MGWHGLKRLFVVLMTAGMIPAYGWCDEPVSSGEQSTIKAEINTSQFFRPSGNRWVDAFAHAYRSNYPDEPQSGWMGLLIAQLLAQPVKIKHLTDHISQGGDIIPELSGVVNLVFMLQKGIYVKDKQGRVVAAQLPGGSLVSLQHYDDGLLVIQTGRKGVKKTYFNNRGLSRCFESMADRQLPRHTYTAYEYNKQKQITKTIRSTYQGEDFLITVLNGNGDITAQYRNGYLEFTYLNEGGTIEKRLYYPSGKLERLTRFSRQPLEFLKWLNLFGNRFLSQRQQVSKYRKYIQELKQETRHYSKKGEQTKREVYQEGIQVLCELFERETVVCRESSHGEKDKTVKRYDAQGQLVTVTNYQWNEEAGELLPVYEARYDTQGDLWLQTYFKQGRPDRQYDLKRGSATYFYYYAQERSDPLFFALARTVTQSDDGKHHVSYYSKYQGIIRNPRACSAMQSRLGENNLQAKRAVPVGVSLFVKKQQQPAATVVPVTASRVGIKETVPMAVQ